MWKGHQNGFSPDPFKSNPAAREYLFKIKSLLENQPSFSIFINNPWLIVFLRLTGKHLSSTSQSNNLEFVGSWLDCTWICMFPLFFQLQKAQIKKKNEDLGHSRAGNTSSAELILTGVLIPRPFMHLFLFYSYLVEVNWVKPTLCDPGLTGDGAGREGF